MKASNASFKSDADAIDTYEPEWFGLPPNKKTIQDANEDLKATPPGH